MRITLLLIIASIFISAKSFSYQEVDLMPKGIEKDYYIWRFLRQPSTTKWEAKQIIKGVQHLNDKLRKAYRKKTGLNPPPPSRKRERYINNSVDMARKKTLTLWVLRSSNPLATWKKLEPDLKIFVFSHAGTKGRKKLDHYMSKEEWQELSKCRSASLMVHYIKRDRLPKLSCVLNYLPSKDNTFRYKYLMKKGLKAIEGDNLTKAEKLFVMASKKAQKRELKDRALFWAWKAKGNRKYLNELVASYSINIYTLVARDYLNMRYDLGITPKLPYGYAPNFDIKDPIDWSRLKRRIFDKNEDLNSLARRFRYSETVGHWSYIKTKANRDIPEYFPMPYRSYMSKLPLTRQAILYAIARQESRFVPASVSSSFALGMMQIMPFLIEHLMRVRQERIDYDDMFDPITALKYANTHLDYLSKWLHHPLFIAYAYNAGIGFTKRLIKRRDLFENKSRFDPWLSLEKVPNEQANEYGKKVLTNYVIYLNKLGYKIRLSALLGVVHRHELTDNFRKR